jgi:ubiquinol-cytochrome c reductase iron-sulfur subunit
MTTDRRKFLSRATTFVAGIGVGLATIPFLRSWRRNAKSAPTEARVKFPKLQPGQIMAADVFGTVVYVLRRTPEMLAGLSEFPDLRDPESAQSEQPEAAKNPHRSFKPDYLIVDGSCTHLGCTVGYMPPGQFRYHGAGEKFGCFFCPCHGSMYDLAGRVIAGVPAPKNLTVPAHRYVEEMEVEFSRGSDRA